jgi:hypothetical protein
MKTKITLLALAWLASGVALAESPGPARHGPDMDRMALLLDLDSYQKTEVEKVLKEQHEQMRALRETTRASGERPSREDMKAKHEQSKQELQTKLSGILNETQLKKFEALHDHHGAGPGRHHRKMHRDAKDATGADTTVN